MVVTEGSFSHTAVTQTGRRYPIGRLALPCTKRILQLGKSSCKTPENPTVCTLDLPSKQQAPRPQGRRTREITSFFPHSLLSPPKMGLSGRKVKQRIPQDPRNLSWADGTLRVLFASSAFLAQHFACRCISLWFDVSIQAGLRSCRQKCHPRHLRSGPRPTSQGKMHPFCTYGLSRAYFTGSSQTRHAWYRSAAHEGSKRDRMEAKSRL